MLSYFSRSVSLLTLSLFLPLLSSFQAHARWATEDEADLECLGEKRVYKVQKDGSWILETDVQWKVLNETGRQALSTQTYSYNANNYTFEVLEAKTSKNGEDFIVPKGKIEDKPLASDSLTLCRNHQVLIPFERLTTNSIVHLKTKKCFKNPLFERYFAESLYFGDSCSLLKNYELQIESEVPLFYKLYDPENRLDVRENKNESIHTLQCTFKKPLFQTRVNEPLHSFADPGRYTSICVSTEKDYERIGKIEASFYQSRLKESLPEKLENIKNIASSVTDEAKCIDTVVTHLMDHMHYLSHMDTPTGALIPRSLKEIVASGQADCKEYSVCLAAILNSLGYQARIAGIERGTFFLKRDRLPDVCEFNHAIVKVTAPSGKIYWVDPTNDVSMVDGIFPDIADRPVEVLDLEKTTYEQTPPIDHTHAVISYDRTITLLKNGGIKMEGAWAERGETAKDTVASLYMKPLSLVKEELLKAFSLKNNPINGTLTFAEERNDSQEIKSRTVRPLQATFNLEEKHVLTYSNHGYAFPLMGNWFEFYMQIPQDNEGALYVGYPETILKKTFVKNVTAQHLDALACSIETPWLNAKRELISSDGGILITEKIEKLKSVIPSQDLKSKEYNELKEKLFKYYDKVVILFSEKGQ